MKRINVMIENIPEQLKALNQWLLWRYEVINGKDTKVPYQPNGHKAQTTNPEHFNSFEAIVNAYQTGDYSGIGFVFTHNDDFTGIDLDDCRNAETGKIEGWALELIETAGSYTEISPSGTGVKIFVCGAAPGATGRKAGYKTGSVEMYSFGRYFTLTGWHLENTPKDVADNQPAIIKIYGLAYGISSAENEQLPGDVKQFAGSRNISEISASQRRIFEDYLSRVANAPTGERSEADHAAIGWGIKIGLSKNDIWLSVKDYGKFAEKGKNGWKYFTGSYDKLLREHAIESTQNKQPNSQPAHNREGNAMPANNTHKNDIDSPFRNDLALALQIHDTEGENEAREYLKALSLDIRSSEAPIITPRTPEQFYNDARTAADGLRVGYTEIDKYIRLRSGGTHIIAARPGVGKTTIMLNFALNQAQELYPDKTFVFLSYEVNEYDLETKAIMSIAGIVRDHHDNFGAYQAYFRDKQQNEPDINEATAQYWQMVTDGRFILKYVTYNVDQLCDAMLSLNSRYDVGAFYVDYIQKIKIDKAGRNLSRQVQLQEISNKLLETSNAMEKPVVLGAQVNRVRGEDKRPSMSEMRESGDIEQDAATIITLWRGDDSDRSRLDWAFEKNRFGMAGETGHLKVDLPISKINNPEKQNEVDF